MTIQLPIIVALAVVSALMFSQAWRLRRPLLAAAHAILFLVNASMAIWWWLR